MKGLKGIIRAVFPPPRRPVRWADAWPLALFVLMFAGACIALDVLDLILYSRLVPFALLALAPWFWWMSLSGYSGLTRGRAAAALLCRLALLGLFIVLLTEPRAVRTDERLSIVFAVDQSASIIPGRKEDALAFVAKAATGKPPSDEAGLVVFGRNAAVELPPAPSLPFEGYINVTVDPEGTNIAKALSLSAALLPPERQGRVLLISDGAANDGELTAVLEDLKAKKIAVDVLGVNYQYDNEVWVERLELPRFVKIGENYEAAVILSAINAGEGRLVLEENGKPIFDQQVKFDAGKNRITIPIYLRDAGYYEYEAKIDLPKGADNRVENNRAISFLHLKGRGRVHVVVDPAGDEHDYQDLVRAMRQSERDVVITNAYDFPRDPLPLLDDDCIFFVNVPRDAFDEMQLKAAHDAVYNQGSGFVMIGGANSFAPGGYPQTDIERLLPVSMDVSQKKRLPKGALAIVLHTCEFPEGNTWAKRITKQAMRVLSGQDEVGVLDYEYSGNGRSGAGWVFNLTPASHYEELAMKINQAQPGDMPDFQATMSLGLSSLKSSDAATKHMIIISDGDPAPPPPSLLQEFVDAKVSVSMVAIFPHGGEVRTMKYVAEITGGRFYFPENPNALPSIFIKEAKTIRRTALQNKVFTPRVENYSEILKGITAMPDLGGYVLTSAKPRSNVILKGPEEDELDPVLSTWRYGTGMAAAFTSDLSTNWGAQWVRWSQYQAFVQQLLTEVSRVGRESNLRIRTFPAEGSGVIFVEDYSPTESFMEVRALVQLPDGQQQTIPVKQTGPRRYEGKFPLAGKGRYQVIALGVGDGPEQRAHGGFVVPYSQEFLRFRSNPIVLKDIAEKTGGRLLKGDETGEQVYAPPREPRQSSRPIADWFLVALACMVPLDIGLRRVQLDWQVIKGWFIFRRVAKEDATMSVLLTRKKQVAATMRGEDKPLRATPRPVRTMSPGSRPKTATKPAEAPPRTAEEPTTTTSRLLEAKRRVSEKTKGGVEK